MDFPSDVRRYVLLTVGSDMIVVVDVADGGLMIYLGELVFPNSQIGRYCRYLSLALMYMHGVSKPYMLCLLSISLVRHRSVVTSSVGL
jgi:hypothetical protein